ncbi:unnamed protein product, partial [Rotaria magnacalcarata]
LRLAHTGKSISENNFKQHEVRNRRRHQNQSDDNNNNNNNNNNNLDSSSLLIIDTDALRTALCRLSTNNAASKQNQNIFDPAYLRLLSRR